MILPIYVYGSAVLREKAQDITPDYPGLKQLIDDMWETMYYADGVGLAAPQVGLSIRLIVIDGKELADEDPSLKDFKRLLINPRILEVSPETCIYSEGCLSVPKLNADVERPKSVKLAYLNEDFQPVEETFDGFAARIVQHEYSHLEGVLFVDLVPAIRKKMLAGKLQEIAKGKSKTFYKTKVVG